MPSLSYASLQIRTNPFIPIPSTSSYEESFRPLFCVRQAEVEQVCRYATSPRAIFVVAPYGGGKTVAILESLTQLKEPNRVAVYSVFRRNKGFAQSLLDGMESAGLPLGTKTKDPLDAILTVIRLLRGAGQSVVLAIDDLDRAADIVEIFRITQDIRDILAEGATTIVTGQPFGVTYDLNTSAGGLFQRVSIPDFSRDDFREMLNVYLKWVHDSPLLSPTHPFDEAAADFVCGEISNAKLTPRLFNFAVSELIEMAASAKSESLTLQAVLSYWPRVAERVVGGLTNLQLQHLDVIFREGEVSEDTDAAISTLGDSPLAEFKDVHERILRPLVEKNLIHVQNISGKELFKLTPQAATVIAESFRKPISPEATDLLRRLWQEALLATDREKKGTCLEEFIAEFFRQVPGFFVPPDGIRLRTKTEELDVVVEVRGYEHHATYGTLIICECKNWSAAVPGDILPHLRDKIYERGCRFGVFVAVNNVLPGFRAKLRQYIQEGIVIALLTRTDFERLEEGEDPSTIIRDSYYRTLKYTGEPSE